MVEESEICVSSFSDSGGALNMICSGLTQSFMRVGSLKGRRSALLRRCKFNRNFSCAAAVVTVQSCTHCIFYP